MFSRYSRWFAKTSLLTFFEPALAVGRNFGHLGLVLSEESKSVFPNLLA